MFFRKKISKFCNWNWLCKYSLFLICCPSSKCNSIFHAGWLQLDWYYELLSFLHLYEGHPPLFLQIPSITCHITPQHRIGRNTRLFNYERLIEPQKTYRLYYPTTHHICNLTDENRNHVKTDWYLFYIALNSIHSTSFTAENRPLFSCGIAEIVDFSTATYGNISLFHLCLLISIVLIQNTLKSAPKSPATATIAFHNTPQHRTGRYTRLFNFERLIDPQPLLASNVALWETFSA